MRKRFLRRMLFGVGALILLMIVSGWVLGAVFGGGWDRGPGNGPRGFFPFPLFLVAGLVALFLIVMRGVRRAAGPVGDVMEAVGRVADGDLTARVEARGGGDDRRLAHAFNRMAERLETDETRRRDLLADLAHELRTPLAVIRGNAEAMLDGLYPADPQHLRTLLDETDVLARLLDDLRTLSTAEAGALVLHREPVTPRALVDDVVSAFTTPAEEREVTLASDVAEGLPTIEVDPVRIGEVLANLLQNALRHTPRGGRIEVAAARASLDGSPTLSFRVTDTGTGIPDELLPHVFDRFVKSADSGGSGLGLAIARSLVEAHGGLIFATSATDAAEGDAQGTTVIVSLPVASH
jgi:two-component system, OmpR family, sensor histidine kinase BaeS